MNKKYLVFLAILVLVILGGVLLYFPLSKPTVVAVDSPAQPLTSSTTLPPASVEVSGASVPVESSVSYGPAAPKASTSTTMPQSGSRLSESEYVDQAMARRPAPKAMHVLSQVQMEQVKSCFPQLTHELAGYSRPRLQDVASLASQKAIEKSASQDIKETLGVENLHITLPNNEQLRLHIVAEDPSGSGQPSLQLRAYKPDVDGDPSRVKIPAKDASNPSPEVIARYLAQGQLSRHELVYTAHFAGSGNLQMTYINGEMTKLESTAPAGFLSCENDGTARSTSCVCDHAAGK
jgi:hypothetical protein